MKENKKTERLEIRLTKEEETFIKNYSKKIDSSVSQIFREFIQKLKMEDETNDNS